MYRGTDVARLMNGRFGQVFDDSAVLPQPFKNSDHHLKRSLGIVYWRSA
jgi:hypothetical protein